MICHPIPAELGLDAGSRPPLDLEQTPSSLSHSVGAWGTHAMAHWRRALICLDVVSSWRCRVVYLRAFSRPSVLVDGWSFSTLIQPFISILEVFANAPTGCTWSYRMITPTITRIQNRSVSVLVKRLRYPGVSSITLHTHAIVLRQSVEDRKSVV